MPRSSTPSVRMPVVSSRVRGVEASWKNLANSRCSKIKARRWFAELLWVAFPAASECELARGAAKVLGVSERSVKNWLRGSYDAPLTIVAAVLVRAGAEVVICAYEEGGR